MFSVGGKDLYKCFLWGENICKERVKIMLTVIGKNGQKDELGEEITIETDGKQMIVYDEKTELQHDSKSALQLLYMIMWFMKKSKKTTLIFKEGKVEFKRKKKYYTRSNSLEL